jgi:itaconyl-CoA hydratase
MPEPSAPYFEDLAVGELQRSRLGRTVLDADNVWFTCLTMNTNQTHFNAVLAEGTEFGKPLVNSCLTLALVTGLSVPGTSEHAVANLGWRNVRLSKPVFVGDTLWAETEVLALRASRSRPHAGIVEVRTRGVNQREQVVIEFERVFMLARRPDAAAEGAR